MGLLTSGDGSRSGWELLQGRAADFSCRGRERVDPRSQTRSRSRVLAPFIFNAHLPATPTGRRQNRARAGGGRQQRGFRRAGEDGSAVHRDLKTAAREERRAQEERTPQNRFHHFCKLETCKSRSGFAPMAWFGKWLLTQK